jgi:crotonobetainyl-CoA:carnitine CoA-transferase CaiB-like acyl-CoA transferase
MNESGFPTLHGDWLRRSGVMSGGSEVARQTVYRCADGYVSAMLAGGVHQHTLAEVVRWMDECGEAPEWLKQIDFSTWTAEKMTTSSSAELMQQVRAMERTVEEFFCGFTRQEIYRQALDRRLLIAPVATVEDIGADEQLAARDYFRSVHYPALGRDLEMVGPFAKMTASPFASPAPSPTLGQHNEAVLCDELGLSATDLQRLYSQKVV